MKHDFPETSPTIRELLDGLNKDGVKYDIETLNSWGVKHRIRTLNERGLIDENSISYDFGHEKGEPAVSIHQQGEKTAHYNKEGGLERISVFSSGSLERTVYFDDSGKISREETVREETVKKEVAHGIQALKDSIKEKMENGGKKQEPPKI